jgi:hypothetical protein
MVTHTELIKERVELLKEAFNGVIISDYPEMKRKLDYNAVLLKASLNSLHGLCERDCVNYIKHKDIDTITDGLYGWEG